MDQHQADDPAECEAGQDAESGQGGAFQRQDAEHLAARDANVAQHAEFAGPCQGLGGEGGGDAEQADDDGDGFQQIGDGETAVEDFQRQVANFGRNAGFHQFAEGKFADAFLHLGRAGIFSSQMAASPASRSPVRAM